MRFFSNRLKNPTRPEPLSTSKTPDFKKRIRIGLKLGIGVALASNVFILLLLGSIWQWDRRVNGKADELLQIQKDLNMRLRESVRGLQDRLIQIPEMLEIDSGKSVFKWIRDNQLVKFDKTIEGRDNYKSLYNRSQRRDITRGRFVIQAGEGSIIVSRGVFDEHGEFKDAVYQMVIESASPEEHITTIKDEVDRIIADGKSGEAMRHSLAVLKAEMADDLFKAEASRTRMLFKIEEINETELLLQKIKKERRTIMWLIAISTVLANILMIFILTRYIITTPLKKVVSSLKSIAEGEGDLTMALAIQSRDELGELSLWFNSFVSKLHGIISQVHQQMTRLRGSVKKLTTVSDDLSENAAAMSSQSKDAVESTELTTEKIEIMAASAQNANDNVMEVTQLSSKVAGAMDELGQSSRDVSSAVSAIASSIEEMYASLREVSQHTSRGTDVTRSATKQADATTHTIKDLRLSTKEISEVVNLIKGIADQTHILSLNAAIEAAGAGESGKGFTIVAHEVKDLARRTATATQTIGKKIKAMQHSTDSVIQTITAVVDTINETHEIMSSIAASVEEQTVTINEISKNIVETSDFAESVTHTLENTIELEKDVQKKLDETSSDARKIAAEAKTVVGHTLQTQQNAMDVEKASQATLKQTRKIKDQISRLNQMYDKLHQIVIQFKLEQTPEEIVVDITEEDVTKQETTEELQALPEPAEDVAGPEAQERPPSEDKPALQTPSPDQNDS